MPSKRPLSVQLPDQVKKSEGPVDVPSLLLVREKEGKPLRHLLISVQISHPAGPVQVRGLIDCGATWNFVSQDLVTRHSFLLRTGALGGGYCQASLPKDPDRQVPGLFQGSIEGATTGGNVINASYKLH